MRLAARMLVSNLQAWRLPPVVGQAAARSPFLDLGLELGMGVALTLVLRQNLRLDLGQSQDLGAGLSLRQDLDLHLGVELVWASL